jgi:hypothetical protein
MLLSIKESHPGPPGSPHDNILVVQGVGLMSDIPNTQTDGLYKAVRKWCRRADRAVVAMPTLGPKPPRFDHTGEARWNEDKAFAARTISSWLRSADRLDQAEVALQKELGAQLCRDLAICEPLVYRQTERAFAKNYWSQRLRRAVKKIFGNHRRNNPEFAEVVAELRDARDALREARNTCRERYGHVWVVPVNRYESVLLHGENYLAWLKRKPFANPPWSELGDEAILEPSE